MNERRLIERIHEAYPIADGSTPRQITEEQQRAVHTCWKLLDSAHRKGRRKRFGWVKEKI